MKYYLGVDIGGSKIKAVLLNGLETRQGKLLSIDTPQNKKEFFGALDMLISQTIRGKKLVGIGVGMPGDVERKRGILLSARNLPFLKGWRAKFFFKKYARQVSLDNDARCMLRAEAIMGAARGYKNAVGVIIGTGIGGGIIIDGKMYYGSRNRSGNFGRMIIERKKDFEDLANKNAFLKMGDRSATIGIGVANLINAFDPDMVVLGGGGIVTGAARIDKIRRSARQYLISLQARKTPIVKGILGDSAGAIGAALLFNSLA